MLFIWPYNAQVDDEQATLARNQLRGSMQHSSLLPSWHLVEPFGASRIEVREAKRLKGMVGTLHPVRAEGANDLLSVCMCDAISHRLKLGKFMFPHGDGCALTVLHPRQKFWKDLPHFRQCRVEAG